MKESIERILSNDILKQEMVEKGYAYAIANFDGKKCAEKVLELYKKTL